MLHQKDAKQTAATATTGIPFPDNSNYCATAPLASALFELPLPDEADLRLVFFFASER